MEDEEEGDSFIDVPYTEFFKSGRSVMVITTLFVVGFVGTFFESFLAFYFFDGLGQEHLAEVAFTSSLVGYSVGAFIFGHIAPRVNQNGLIVVSMGLIAGSALLGSGLIPVSSYFCVSHFQNFEHTRTKVEAVFTGVIYDFSLSILSSLVSIIDKR